jgi:DeoR/GlpR family transcriptional regulator of sugar metabolism
MIVYDKINSMSTYLKEERQQLILESIQQDKKVTVSDLSKRFGISEVTIRRDLQELASSGQLLRTHRGALAARQAPPEPPVVQRMHLQRITKERISSYAATLISDGDSIFIGSGSTTHFLAGSLAEKKNLTVFTNALSIAQELSSSAEEITVVVIGGVLRKPELSLLGHIAELSLSEIRYDKVFMGMQAVSIFDGLTTDHLPEVTTTRRVIENGRELIVLADHSKLGKTAAAFIAPIQVMHTLVTDDQADGEFIQELQNLAIQVILA